MFGWQPLKYYKPKSFTRDQISVSYVEFLQGMLSLPQGRLYTYPCSLEICLFLPFATANLRSSFFLFSIVACFIVISFSGHVSNFSLFALVPSMKCRTQETQDIERYHENTIIVHQVSKPLSYIDQCICSVFDYNFLHNDLLSGAISVPLCRVN